jgi:hypothetical protein
MGCTRLLDCNLQRCKSFMDIIQSAGFNIAKVQRNQRDWYIIAIKLNQNTFAAISNPLQLGSALAAHGRPGHVILKFPQGYSNPAQEYLRWNTQTGDWGPQYPINDPILGGGGFNGEGMPQLPDFVLGTCNIVESGLRANSHPNSDEHISGNPSYIQVTWDEVNVIDYMWSDGTGDGSVQGPGWWKKQNGGGLYTFLGQALSEVIPSTRQIFVVAGIGGGAYTFKWRFFVGA